LALCETHCLEGLTSVDRRTTTTWMDPILRTALDWFITETHSSGGRAEVRRHLRELRAKIDKLPSRLFSLESPDEPYALAEILVVMGKNALAWQLNPDATIERKLLGPQVEEILHKALHLRGLLAADSKRGGGGKELPRLPLGEIRRSMENRGEPLPDRL
jgi:hypothetical protein